MCAFRLVPAAGIDPRPAPAPKPGLGSLDEIFSGMPADRIAQGAAVFWESDAATDLFQVVEGCLRLYRILPDGRRAIMGFRFAGDMLGLSCRHAYPYTAEAVTPVRLRRISRSRLRAMGQTADRIDALVMAGVIEEMNAAHRHIIVLGQLGAEERVADFLLAAARRNGPRPGRPVAIELPMTRLDIADYLGLTIETVCRVVSRFKRDGLIALEGRHRVVLRRVESLRALADVCDEEEEADEPIAARRSAGSRH